MLSRFNNDMVLALGADRLRVYAGTDWRAQGDTAPCVVLQHEGRLDEALASALATRPRVRVPFFNRLHVVVGNPWARSAVLPWQSGLHSESAWEAYARAWFAARGHRGQWRVRVQDDKYGSVRLSSILCVDVLASLEKACKATGWRLASVRDELSSLLSRCAPPARQENWCLLWAERHVVTCLFRQNHAWRDLVMLPRVRDNVEEWLTTGSLLSDLTIPNAVYAGGLDLPAVPEGIQRLDGLCWRPASSARGNGQDGAR